MSNDLSITLIQTDLHWENPEANLKMFDEKISSITEPTDIIILPEMFITGFSMNVKKFAETPKGETFKKMQEWAAKKNAVVCGSLIFKKKLEYFNRLIWMQPNGDFSHYDKRHLFGLGEENIYYSSGVQKKIIQYKDWRIKALICYDLRFPVWCRNKNNYDLLIFVANWPEKRIYAWKQLLIARAIENQCYVAAVNRVGLDGNDIYYSGESMLIDPKGEVLEHIHTQEKIITGSISLEHLKQVRKEIPFLKDADEFKIVL